jgi:hypothetical protein
VIEADVSSDPRHPRSELVTTVEPGKALVDLQESFLCSFLSIVGIDEHAAADPFDLVPITVVDRWVSVAIACLESSG